ncbi:hypothetical protein [Protoparvovirus primate1]|uniref:Uncharacterized protein n=2 Tax=Parvovirinae TaxID=40119 RepID=I6YJQ5_9VIRU|nr:hypothetical protein [Protoparvovirus primate1]AFN54513.1 hypothetical protein [Bufavirus-1]AFN54514.1 hypothetical protein [Bufavirus-1]AFN54515.1 hypothetical protein [Protoparvovirus primate1]
MPAIRKARGKFHFLIITLTMEGLEQLWRSLPCLIGFCLMLLFFLFFLWTFLSSYFNWNSKTNLARQLSSPRARSKRTLLMSFLPTLLSLTLVLLIWSLFIWLFYFDKQRIINILLIKTENGNYTFTIQPL